METTLFKVISKSEPVQVTSKKDGSLISKCIYRLQNVDGDDIIATAFGEGADTRVNADDLIFGTVRFDTREYEGRLYMEARLVRFVPIEKKINY